jgi:hypothetical protein
MTGGLQQSSLRNFIQTKNNAFLFYRFWSLGTSADVGSWHCATHCEQQASKNSFALTCYSNLTGIISSFLISTCIPTAAL